MTAARLRRQTLARVVLTLLLAAALGPTLSRGLAHVRGMAQPWAQGCATAGQVAGPARPTPADIETWHHLLEHCPLCSLGPDLPDGMPSVPATLPLLALADAGPCGAFDRPDPAHAAQWRAQPRAPPTLS